ncbi:hypothetical protein BJ973_002400 [Actinoplanes tereljensis]|uniref:Uncharacterized protein n=1 Tax=Paractinoplanes tereljensis TaxID=571912 RepID=A0A919NP28_9ACTN|nr:cache domain-containing protein [Actinoplanes tereljensis]GIF22073.1 hypothetical protein Ate02nite_48030 [Actinoplanes tereljensis]
MQGGLGTARDVAQATDALSLTDGSRKIASAELRAVLAAHTDYLGVWTGWEPNAFDGQDSSYRNKTGHDATGRFIPYWYRDGSTISLAPLTDYTVEGTGDYYLVPKNTKAEKIIEPYTYAVGGKDVLMTAANSGDVAHTITGVADVASSTADIAGTTQQAATNLSKLAADLTALVGTFRY